MESEKVKEIKKALEYCSTPLWTKCDNCSRADEDSLCMYRLQADALTLINELESENESCYEVLADLKAIIKQQNDRIAELEKENKILQGTKERLTFADRIELVNNAVEIKLKQFAERLKEKYGKSCSEYYPLLLELTSEQLDETLNEF